MQDDLSDSLGKNLADILGDKQSEPELTKQSQMVSMLNMMEKPQEMLNNATQ